MTHSSLKILIVDDDEGDRKQMRRVLKQTGLTYECSETLSIQEALEACKKYYFDCVLVDYRMPGYDGLSGIDALYKQAPYTSIIMVTGEGGEEIATEAMRRGASDYISKKHLHAESIGQIILRATEKTTLQRKVLQQQEELENFARMLVHDLKSPIHALYGFADFVEECIGEGKPEKIIEQCHSVVNLAQRMNALIDTLYQYTAIDAQVKFGPVDMRLALEGTISNLKSLIQERGARVTHDELPIVFGNASLLAQLLQNLICNGIKYCAAETPFIHVAAREQEGAAWLFSVKDNGIGIPENDYKNVFKPFIRLEAGNKHEGTGLGLATCMKIVERHGGAIWCESKEGRGTTFFFTLQKVDSQAESIIQTPKVAHLTS